MRQIAATTVILFMSIFSSVIAISTGTSWWLLTLLPSGDFYGVAFTLLTVIFIYLYMILSYRLCLKLLPLTEGEIPEGSREEFSVNLNNLYFLLVFNTIIFPGFLPVPLMRLFYQALGAELGHNTYSVGAILDPALTRIGSNCIIGIDAVLYCHAIEGKRLAMAGISIGDNVTIGAKAIIMSGVHIGDGAIIAAGAIVNKGIHIGADELWGGVPARCLRTKQENQPKLDTRHGETPSI
jgi:acetyltransferase-like isoleucine patch superfamily enzyme